MASASKDTTVVIITNHTTILSSPPPTQSLITHSLITTYQLTEEKRRLQQRDPYRCCRWWSKVYFPLWFKQTTFDHSFYPAWRTNWSRRTVFLDISRDSRREDRCSHVGSRKNSISLRNDVRWNGLSGWYRTLLCLVFRDQDTKFDSFDRVMFNIY